MTHPLGLQINPSSEKEKKREKEPWSRSDPRLAHLKHRNALRFSCLPGCFLFSLASFASGLGAVGGARDIELEHGAGGRGCRRESGRQGMVARGAPGWGAEMANAASGEA